MAVAPAEPDFLPAAPANAPSRVGRVKTREGGDSTAASAAADADAASSLYPAFRDYPVASVELLRMERERIQALEEALIRRRRVSSSRATCSLRLPSLTQYMYARTMAVLQNV
jgi:hypothetical protein